MYIGYCKITLRLPENHSLKGKRQIIRSLIDKIGQRFHVAVSEVEHHDLWQITSLGIACVSSDKIQIEKLLNQLSDFLLEQMGHFELTDIKKEITAVF